MTAILTDPHLRQCLADIVKQAKVSCIVETGTNTGDSALEFSKLVPRVFTVEMDPELHAIAKTRMPAHVSCNLGHSVTFLRQLLGPIVRSNRDGNVMFVLDAHWHEDWPLMEELWAINAVRKSGYKFVAIIDDWLVPNCPQFTGCYGGLRSDDSKGREHLLQPCAYSTFAAELDSWPHFYEPIYQAGGIGYAIFSDFELELGENFRRVR